MLPPPKGGGFVVTDSSPVPSQARLKVSPPEVGSKPSHLRWARSPPTRGGLIVPVLHTKVFRAWPPLVRDGFRHHRVRHVPAAAAEVPVLPFLSAGPQGFHGPTALFGPCSHLKTEEPKYPRAPRCRPQNCFRNGANSCNSLYAVFPFSRCTSRLIVTCGGSDTSRCTCSLLT